MNGFRNKFSEGDKKRVEVVRLAVLIRDTRLATLAWVTPWLVGSAAQPAWV